MDENQKLNPQEISNEMVCSIANLAALGVDGIDKMFMRMSDAIISTCM